MDDFREFKPTFLAMVPRLLNKLYDKVRLESNKKGIVGRIVFQLAVRNKLALIQRGIFSQNTIWDRIMFKKIRQLFGDQVNLVISTSAPLSAQICAFSRAVFSCSFYELYGQTECVAGFSQTKNDTGTGEIGIPTSINYIKLIDVPEKEYFAKDGIGEICIKSPGVFNGYLKDEAKTRETIDEQGWLHTGDIGRWTPHKTMRVVDREKNMYKVSFMYSESTF
jgi:long-chain acyl-CoA synthetase